MFPVGIPKLQINQEVGFFVFEQGMLFICSLGLVQRALAGVDNFQRRHDNQHFSQAMQLAGCQYHARQARIHRQAGDVPAQFGQYLLRVHSAKLVQ